MLLDCICNGTVATVYNGPFLEPIFYCYILDMTLFGFEYSGFLDYLGDSNEEFVFSMFWYNTVKMLNSFETLSTILFLL